MEMGHNLPTALLIALLLKRITPEDYAENQEAYERLAQAIHIEDMDAWYVRKARENVIRG